MERVKEATVKLVVPIINLVASVPLSLLYVISDYILYPIIRYIIRYRRNVVGKNFALAFPEKNDKERLKMEKSFYHYICDLLVETIRLRNMNKEELEERFIWENMDEITANNGKLVVNLCYTAHYSNWEWAICRLMPTDHSTPLYVYHPLRNRNINEWICKNRSKYGALPVDMYSVSKVINSLPNEPMTYTIIIGADQRPKEQYVRHFHRFMGIKTKVMTGTEQLIGRFGMNVYYCEISKIERGKYKCTPRLITEGDLDKAKSEWPYTDLYFDKLQKQIICNPEQWLWSHDRWKR